MPTEDTYPHAEERRLFYVALTRARRSALLLTTTGRESPFLLELIRDQQLTLESATGQPITLTMCPACQVNRMVHRTGPYGPFLGCSTYPKCRGTRRLPSAP